MSKNREKSSFQADMTLLTLVVLLTVLGLVILSVPVNTMAESDFMTLPIISGNNYLPPHSDLA